MKLTHLIVTTLLIILFSTCKKKTDSSPSPTVSVVPDIEVNYAVSKLFVKSNEIIQFTNQSKNAERYDWDFGDGETSTLESPEHSFKAKGTYTVSLIASKGNKQSRRDTLVRCDLIASITFTHTYSDFTPPANWPKHMYVRFVSLLYDSEDSTTIIKSSLSNDLNVNNSNNFVFTYQLTDEKIKYKLKTNIFLFGLTTGPDPNTEYMIRDFEGTFYTDSFDLHSGLPNDYFKSKKMKYITINCFASRIQFN